MLTQQDWHQLSTDEVLAMQESDGHNGLSSTEAEARLRKFGPNAFIARKGPHALLRFMQQFNNPLIYVLLVAGITTALIPDHAVDSIAIFAVILINAFVGFVQESRAQAAIAALSRLIKVETSVMRDGRVHRIDASTLVPGDLVLLQSGDRVPADIRLLRQREIQVDEAMLTGESLPAAKEIGVLPTETPLADRKNMAYSGTLVTFGQATGIVIATGGATELGRISNLIEQAETLATPLTRKLSQLSVFLSWIIIGLAMLTFAVGLLRGQQVIDTFIAAVALAVAAIPEGLPAAVTIILAIGVTRMAERNAVIRKLPAVETLGSTSVICSDKTGTLTENQMTVAIIETQEIRCTVTGTGYQPDGELLHEGRPFVAHNFKSLIECLHAGILCNDAQLVEHAGQWQIEGDPTEGALLTVAWKGGIDPGALRDAVLPVDTIPFESERQYMASLRQLPEDDKVIYAKGAVERIITMCQTVMVDGSPTSALDREYWRQRADALAAQGLRVLAFAMKPARKEQTILHPDDLRDGLIFLGLQGMIDPPRPEATTAVQACQQAGVNVKMITGDHALTASTIAAAIGIGGQKPVVITGRELGAISDEELATRIQNIDVFARVAPEQKMRLVKALQAQNAVVAMTGDGVNDAPALKQANIGIAMGITGTETAKDAADMVLTDDNFASIEAAVEEGRGVYENLRKFITWTLPTNGGEGLLVVIAIALGIAIPILPLHLLWIKPGHGHRIGHHIGIRAQRAWINATTGTRPARADLLRRSCSFARYMSHR